MLTESEIATYHDRGYVVPDWRVPADTLAAMRDAADHMLKVRPHYADMHPALLEEGAPWPEFGAQAEILTMVGQLIGEDIILWSSGYFGKPADVGKATPWHQDGGYWPIRPLATCTAWVALDDATPENGCMRMIPGSHKPQVLYDHDRNDADNLTLNQELPSRSFDETKAEYLELKAGQISLHDVYMVHCSAANTSPHRRRGITFRYMPATSHFDRDLARRQHREMGVVEHEFRTLFQVSGIDACGKNELIRLRPAA